MLTQQVIAIALFAAFSAGAQQPERYYARAYYTKWKPGKQTEVQSFIKDVPLKAMQIMVKKEPEVVGQITMSRVLPGGNEINHDRLRIQVLSKPPDFGAIPALTAAVESTGMSYADYSAKLRSFYDTVRTEIWQSIYRHGSIREGDYVRVSWHKYPAADASAGLNHLRTWSSGMSAELVKRGSLQATETWNLLHTADQPTRMSVIVYKDAASLYASPPNQQEVFFKAHPGKDYHAYRQSSSAVTRSRVNTQVIVYRVDTAVWK